MDEGDTALYSCKCCNRNFRLDVLRKHEPICIKSNRKQRKIFDSGKQRAQGSDVPLNKTLKPGEVPKPDPKLAQAEARTKQWRQKHELLISSFQAARNYAKAKNTGAPLPPPPPPVIDSSLVQCPFCQRRFNEDACNRHIPFCKDQQAKLGSKGNSAKKPLYKAPPLKPKPPTPGQKTASLTSNGCASQSSTSHSIPTRVGMTSNLPVKTTKTNLPTRTVASSRPQPSPPTNMTSQSNAGGSRVGSYNPPAPRGSIKTSTTIPTTTKTAIRKPAGSTNTTVKSVGFCHECGASFTLASARFCSECGVRRLAT